MAWFRYIQECVREQVQPSALFASPGFRLEHVAADSMHCGDLGSFQDAVGGVFWVEVDCKDFHRSRAAGVEFLNRELRRYYAANPGFSAMHLTLGMLKGKQDTYPSLKCKAAECRHLAAFLVVLANLHAHGAAGRGPLELGGPRLGPYSGEYRVEVVALATSLHRYHAACQADPFVCQDCKAAMYGFLSAMSKLRLLFRRHLPLEEHTSMPFVFRPKIHMLQHVVEEHVPRWLSPANFWCYSDEDFVGLMKRICLNSKHPASMERVLLLKFRLLAGLNAIAHG